MTAPLDGLLVADFSRVLAGPFATMHLADLGARVVKVERPGTGDETRSWGPPWTERSSAYFDCVNRSKQSITLDLSDPGDRDVARELAERADVLVENFLPGTMARYGLDHPTLARSNPGLIYCSISGFGSAAGASAPGYDFLVQAVGGLMSITGDAAGEPTKVGVALVDVLTGKDAVIGILAALARRASTGQGDRIEVSLLSSLLGGLVNQAASYLTTGQAPSRQGNRHPSITPYESFPCADAPIAIACGNDAQFARLVAAIGLPELGDDARFATNPARVQHREELAGLLSTRLRTRSSHEWESTLTAAGVPAGLVQDIGSAIGRAEELGLNPLIQLEDGSRHIRHPILFTHAGTARPTTPPTLGEHSNEVRQWLAER